MIGVVRQPMNNHAQSPRLGHQPWPLRIEANAAKIDAGGRGNHTIFGSLCIVLAKAPADQCEAVWKALLTAEAEDAAAD